MAGLKARYEHLAPLREPFLQRARECALYTIPALMPPEGWSGSSVLPTPYQGLGARGVRNLASKLLLALAPPNTPNFKLDIDDYQIAELVQGSANRGDFDRAFNKIERAVLNEQESSNYRVTLFEVLKQLLVSGTLLMFLRPDGGAKVYRLDRFVVRRDPSDGTPLEFLIHEKVAPEALDADVINACSINVNSETNSPEQFADVYTLIRREPDGSYVSYQEINDLPVPDSHSQYPKDGMPWHAPRLTPDGDYSRSYVEELLGDLISYDGMAKHILDGAAAAAKVLLMNDPNGVTRSKDLEKENLSIINGRAQDVTALRLDKGADFNVAFSSMQEMQKRLEHSFLLNAAIQRSGERVTAEEIRLMASELEDALGGVYSGLSQELQLPVTKYQLWRMTREKRLPALPKGVVKPKITTGLQALGRGHDLQKMRNAIADLAQYGQAAQALPEINREELFKRIFAAHGIDANGLVYTEEEMQQQQMAAQAGQMMTQAGPEVAKQVTAAAMGQ